MAPLLARHLDDHANTEDLNGAIYLPFEVVNIHDQSAGVGGGAHPPCLMMVINDDLKAHSSLSHASEVLMIKSINPHSFPILISWGR